MRSSSARKQTRSTASGKPACAHPSAPAAARQTAALFEHVFPKPYIDVLRLFSCDGWALAERRGNVREHIDETIGKSVVSISGAISPSNLLALPAPRAPPLGLRGRLLYLQLQLQTTTPGAACDAFKPELKPFVLHLDLMTSRRFVVRLSISSRRSVAKKAGSVYQMPCPQPLLQHAGKWTLLCVDLKALLLECTSGELGDYHSLRGLVLCSTISVRALFISDKVYTPETLPRQFLLPVPGKKAWHDVHASLWIPSSPQSGGLVQRSSADGQLEQQADTQVAAFQSTHGAADARVHRSSPSFAVRQPLGPLGGVSQPTAPAHDGSVSLRPPPAPRRRFAHAPPGSSDHSGGTRVAGGPLHDAAPLLTASAASEQAPPPMLSLRRVIGFSGERPGLLLWLSQPELFLYATAAVLVIQRIDSGEQRLLLGHASPICAIAAAQEGGLIASAEEGPSALIRLWHRATGECLALLQLHASDVQSLAISPDGAMLAAVGKDARGRQLLALWDVTGASDAVPTCTLIDARVSLHHVRRVAFVPSDNAAAAAAAAAGHARTDVETQLVTCGFENLRFWRLKRGKLHSCSVPLQHHEGEMLLDLALESGVSCGGGERGRAQRRLLASSSRGKVFQVDVSQRSLEYVFALHDAPINAVSLSAGFAVTGSADHKLRVWPLDFSNHFLEAEHEGPVTAVHASADGLKLLVGTSSGAIGVLDVPSQQHATLVRSHTDIVYGLAADPHNREFATACCDGTVRIWDLDTPHQQLVEFEVTDGCARVVAYHPTEYAMACGFDDGAVRIFDIASTSLLEEYKQHDGRVLALTYAHKAHRLFSADSRGSLCAYDVLHSYQPCRAYTASPHDDSPCLAATPDEACLVVGGLQAKAVLVFECASLRLLRTLSLTAQVHALSITCERVLHGACAGPSIFSLMLDDEFLFGGAEPRMREVGNTHRALAEALAVSPDGLVVATGGTDRMLKVWPGAALCDGRAVPCEAYIGHSDHLTNLAFSPDGNSLISVGGGDTIFVWDVNGARAREDALAEAIVDESLRQATEEREAIEAAEAEAAAQAQEPVPSPADVLAEGSAEFQRIDQLETEAAILRRTREAPVGAQAAERGFSIDGIVDLPVDESKLALLKERLAQLDLVDAEAAGDGALDLSWGSSVAAERVSRAWLEASSFDAGSADGPGSCAAVPGVSVAAQMDLANELKRVPRKRYVQRAMPGGSGSYLGAYGGGEDDDEEEWEAAYDEEGGDGAEFGFEANVEAEGAAACTDSADGGGLGGTVGGEAGGSDESGYRRPAAPRAESSQLLQQDATGADADADSESLAERCASQLGLQRLLGFSNLAHDHVHWDQQRAKIYYATGDKLVVHDVATAEATPLSASGSEISTLAVSPTQDLVALASGSGGATCVWALRPSPELRATLKGHEGGVQALAFCGEDMLVSLGLQDGLLRVQSLAPNGESVWLQAELPSPQQYVLLCNAETGDVYVGGDHGVLNFRICAGQETGAADALSLAAKASRCALSVCSEAAAPVTALLRLHRASPQSEPREADLPTERAELTTDADPGESTPGESSNGLLLLAGTALADIQLWRREETAPMRAWSCAPRIDEVDLLHASPLAPSSEGDVERCVVIAAGAGPRGLILVYALSLHASRISNPSDASGGAPSLHLVDEIGIGGVPIAMSWSVGATQGVVGTDAATIVHVHLAPPAEVADALATGDADADAADAADATYASAVAVAPIVSAPQRHIQHIAGLCASGKHSSLLATVSATAHASESSSVSLWLKSNGSDSRASLEADAPLSCVALVRCGYDALCAAGSVDGSIALFSTEEARMLASASAHEAEVVCIKFVGANRLISASSLGDVRLHALRTDSASGLASVAFVSLLKPINGVAVDSLELLHPLSPNFSPRTRSDPAGTHGLWACGSAHQEVQVSALPSESGDAEGALSPIAQLRLEADALLVLPSELKAMGWRCCAAFCNASRRLVACSGVTRIKRLLLFDFVTSEPVIAISLDEWPTCLVASSDAPLLALGLASGSVKLISYPSEEQRVELDRRAHTLLPGLGGLDSVEVRLHAASVRSLQLSGRALFSASGDETAEWSLDAIVA